GAPTLGSEFLPDLFPAEARDARIYPPGVRRRLFGKVSCVTNCSISIHRYLRSTDGRVRENAIAALVISTYQSDAPHHYRERSRRTREPCNCGVTASSDLHDVICASRTTWGARQTYGGGPHVAAFGTHV